ncbi:LOW QUALITY PROTEIN: kelch-like protein 3 [Metopolophium dirhodum]|uniref:LOW QUALITY PROTEIN: kelch-like protein 3 n=1 Tax=Metopolophium dirhodum TaxID=44670 RepID=UPI00298F7C8E|nr:LOW QUALITY PROTEIN: kelch-like protein 3 [Metopolophium dirhodum]
MCRSSSNPGLDIQFTMQSIKQISESRICDLAKYEYEKLYYSEVYEVLQSLRNDEVFCDIKLETDDNKIIFAHKVVLASASPYFHAMFTNFAESNHDLVVMKQFDSTALQLLVDFIYSGKILITEDNVLVLLPAANLLQLEEVKDVCCNFLQTQLCPTNCIGIYAIADLHSCTELLTSSELYIQHHFSEVFGGDEFLSLSSEQVVKLISSDKLIVPSEEKVFESVIRWVNHESGSRKCILPQLMEHIRLPLTSKNYIRKKVLEEPLIKNCFKCKDYIIEALNFHNNILKSEEFISQNIRNKPRYGDKVILAVGGMTTELSKRTEWYDPKINRWNYGLEMITSRGRPGLAVMNDNLVFVVGGFDDDVESLQSVDVLDLSSESPCWKPSVGMLVKRDILKVGVIDNYLYAVGGHNDSDGTLDTAEVFDYNTQEWRMISSMSTLRFDFGAGVLNNLLYVVGGLGDSSQALDTVECYDPSLDTWTPITKMCVHRRGAGVGTLDGVLYAVGGHDGFNYLSSVETYKPSTGVWTSIGEMNLPRRHAGVVTLDGLLYVVGGDDENSNLDAVECYNPKTNTWTMVTASMNDKRISVGVVVINRTQHFKTC